MITYLGSGLVTDQCGVCGGNGTSCLDCNDEVFGSAKLDRCGICNGDGQSCLNCDDEVITTTLAEMDNGAAIQADNIKKLANRFVRKKKTRGARRTSKKLKALAEELRNANWEILSGVPQVSTTCTNRQFCTSVSNQDKLTTYAEGSEELRKVGQKLIRKLSKVISSRKAARLQSKNNQLHNDNLAEACHSASSAKCL